ncbi:MAG TPA: hypothetical protein DCS09_02145 [Porphyromonadaceae bacterium]|nr:hypothetical protein [Porphyromonadaceae bacterium]
MTNNKNRMNKGLILTLLFLLDHACVCPEASVVFEQKGTKFFSFGLYFKGNTKRTVKFSLYSQ